MKKFKILVLIFFCFFIFNIKVSALEDGIYTIHSAINKNYVLDLYGANASNGGNIQLYTMNKSNAQKFKIAAIDNGYYEISSLVNSNYSLDVYGANFNNLTNVQVYSSNKSNAQKWLIKPANNGNYYIYSYDNIHCLDVNSGVAAKYSNVQLYRFNGTLAQQFYFEKIFDAKQTISDGLYSISTKLNENMFMEVASAGIYNNSNIQLYENNATDAQKWFVKYLGNGYYSIKPYLSLDFSIEVAGAGTLKGTNLQLYRSNATDAQKWIIYDNGDGYYNIVSVCNNLVIDVYNGNAINGANIWFYDYNGSNAQKFKFNNVVEKGNKTIDDGYYFINTSLSINKVLDIYDGSMTQFNNVQIFNLNSSLAQKWYIKYLNDGYYSILSDKDSNFALERDQNGSNVRISNYTNDSNQKWIIKKTDNYYYVISDDGRYLDLASASTTNGNNIGVFKPNASSAQKFNFRKTTSGLSDKVIQDGIYIISSSLDSYKVMEAAGGGKTNGTNVQLYSTNGSNAQKWEVKYLSNGYYKISNLLDLTKSFDVYGANYHNGTNVQLYDNNNSLAQQWLIKDAGDGYFYIISNCNGLYVEAAGGGKTNGTNIQMYEGNGTKAQKFKFIKSEEKTRVIDVSYHQGDIDWNKVADSGIYGVILRIGYWSTEDEKFSEYINEVKRLEIPYGIYIFSYANTTNGATVEANFTKNIIGKYNLNPTLGIYYDLEDWYLSADNTSHTLSKSQYDDIARTYINNVSSYVGSKYKVKIYADLNHVNNRFGDYVRGESDWIAHYGVSSCGYKGSHSLWQYTSEATLDGIKGYVDMNYLY